MVNFIYFLMLSMTSPCNFANNVPISYITSRSLKKGREVDDVNLTHEILKGTAFTTDWPREVVTTEGVVTSKLCAES